MKKVIILAIAFVISSASIRAQSFGVSTNVVSAGVGFGSSIGSYSGSQTPALSLQFERGIMELGEDGVLSLGAYLGIKSFKHDWSNFGFAMTEKWNYTIVGARAAYHYTGLDMDNLDVYGGLMLSYNILKYKFKDNSNNPGGPAVATNNYSSSAGFTAYVGGRYYFTENLAGFGELGYGVSYLTLGLALKL